MLSFATQRERIVDEIPEDFLRQYFFLRQSGRNGQVIVHFQLGLPKKVETRDFIEVAP